MDLNNVLFDHCFQSLGELGDHRVVTEAWFRNPDQYIRELVEQHVVQIAWDRGYLVNRRVDPLQHATLYYAASDDFRLLIVGVQGTAELRRGRDLDDPVAVYPTWEYGVDDIEALEEMLGSPVGENQVACSDMTLAPDERPVFGQEHRVVIVSVPPANTGPGKTFLRLLSTLQVDYPAAIIHMHGAYAFRVNWGLGFRSADYDARASASRGRVMLPNGKEIRFEEAVKWGQWLHLLGYTVGDLAVPRNRCMFNIKSARWAAEHYADDIKFNTQAKGYNPQPLSAIAPPIPTTNAVNSTGTKAIVGDKYTCDSCSLQNTCKYFRAGGVCTLPDAEPASLARFFKTRDSGLIIDGLGALLELETKRLETGISDESMMGELDPEVTKIINTLFDRGVKLAKLIDPVLAAAGAPRTQVNILNGSAPVPATPQQLVAGIVAELEQRGVRREDITPQMITNLISAPAAIEASSSVNP